VTSYSCPVRRLSPLPELETKSLPESAYEVLKPGQSYPPIVAANVNLPELTARSIGWGIFLCIIFTIAAAYSGLKVGQVMESAIPISILAIGLARLYHRRSTLLENVIITGIGGVAGPVVAGAVFTIPLYILKLDPHPSAGRRVPVTLAEQAIRKNWQRTRQNHSRTWRHHRVRTDGGRCAGRRPGCGFAFNTGLSRRSHQDALLLQRAGVANHFCNAVCRPLPVCLV